jgi:hypothetical protein
MTEKIPTAFGMVTPAPKPSFLPDEWARGWAERMVERERRMLRNMLIADGIDPDNRPTVMVEQRIPDDVLAARAEFKARWDALVQEGLDSGHLEHEHCFECGGPLTVPTNTTTWESRPNPAFDPDKPNPYAGGVSVVLPARARNVIITTGDPR